jgi:glycosyltransferase Alg8
VVEREFIRNVEADRLEHWLWGNFRFLSGDDKSTWYSLLKKGGKMTYVPDAMVYTIEHIEGLGVLRMRDNVLRWSGNMLRNGARAIALGPRKMPPFIWWCLIDQRVSIWTVLSGFAAAVSITIFINGDFIFSYILWIGFTRFIMASSLFFFSDRIRISYPFFLYANQIVSSLLKVYIMFHLPRQRWSNRQGQTAGEDVMKNPFRRAMAGYINLLYVSTMLLIVFLITGILEWPARYQL